MPGVRLDEWANLMHIVIGDLTNRLRNIESDIAWYSSIRQPGRTITDIDTEISYLRSKKAQYERALEVLRNA